MRTWICLVAASILGVAPVLAAEQFDRKAELSRLKAHYVGKVVTVKTDLPRTDGGFVFINDDKLDTIGLSKALQGSSSLGIETGGVEPVMSTGDPSLLGVELNTARMVELDHHLGGVGFLRPRLGGQNPGLPAVRAEHGGHKLLVPDLCVRLRDQRCERTMT